MLRRLIGDLFRILFSTLPMVIAGAMIAGLLSIGGWAAGWRWYQWIPALPLLYMAWLIALMTVFAGIFRLVARRNPKPRYRVYKVPVQGRMTRGYGMAGVAVAYNTLGIIGNLPLIKIMETCRLLRNLFYYAYSIRVQIGEGCTNMGTLYDPDLIEIGDYVMIGGRAVIEAHAVSTRSNGSRVYVSAPVKIGTRATIGGLCHVPLGCVLGEDVILEAGTYLSPFTNVPPGEVWGGNPAHFLRKRTDLAIGTQSEPLISAAPARQSDLPAGREELRQLVTNVLNLPATGTHEELSAETCAAWDSLGQVAIATGIYDRYGISVDASQIFRIKRLEDIEAIISGNSTPKPQPEDSIIPDDVEMLPLLDAGEATRALAGRAPDQTQILSRLRLVIGANFTALPIENSVKLWGRAFGLDLDCNFTGYDRVLDDLLDGKSEFALNRDGVNAVLIRPEDLSEIQLDQLLGAIEAFAAKLPGSCQFVVGSLPPVVSSFASIDAKQIGMIRDRWRARVENIPRVHLLDFAGVVERLGIENARSTQSEILTRAPYSPRLYQNLGIALVREILSRRRSSAKVVAIDCDNTLWGGVLGEVGPASIQLGSDGSGRSYRLFQEYVKRLKERGLLLVVLSKNEEADVRDVFENHPEMVLRPDDIAAWRVNWRHKSENLQEVAANLGLGLDSFVFLDDDPQVRAEMKMRLPQVHVVPFPEDHTKWCGALSLLWLFDGGQSTEEDSSRTRMAHEEELRHQGKKSAASLEEFLASLELAVEVGPPGDLEWTRVAQLTQRTNQFNSSLKRRTVEEIMDPSFEGGVLVLKARDRFGDYGLTGLALMRPASPEVFEIDTLLMSCRVLGRGVEDAFLHAIAETAAAQGARILRAPFTPGPRNAQVLEYLARHNFAESEKNVWEVPLSDRPSLPTHIRLDWRKTRVPQNVG